MLGVLISLKIWGTGAPVGVGISGSDGASVSSYTQGWNCWGVGELNPSPSSCLQTLIF